MDFTPGTAEGADDSESEYVEGRPKGQRGGDARGVLGQREAGTFPTGNEYGSGGGMRSGGDAWCGGFPVGDVKEHYVGVRGIQKPQELVGSRIVVDNLSETQLWSRSDEVAEPAMPAAIWANNQSV